MTRSICHDVIVIAAYRCELTIGDGNQNSKTNVFRR